MPMTHEEAFGFILISYTNLSELVLYNIPLTNEINEGVVSGKCLKEIYNLCLHTCSYFFTVLGARHEHT